MRLSFRAARSATAAAVLTLLTALAASSPVQAQVVALYYNLPGSSYGIPGSSDYVFSWEVPFLSSSLQLTSGVPQTVQIGSITLDAYLPPTYPPNVVYRGSMLLGAGFYCSPSANYQDYVSVARTGIAQYQVMRYSPTTYGRIIAVDLMSWPVSTGTYQFNNGGTLTVDFQDINVWSTVDEQFGSTPRLITRPLNVNMTYVAPASASPEPGTLALAAAGLLTMAGAVIAAKRRRGNAGAERRSFFCSFRSVIGGSPMSGFSASLSRIGFAIAGIMAAIAALSSPARAQSVTLGFAAPEVSVHATDGAGGFADYSVTAFSTMLPMTSGVNVAGVNLGTLTGYAYKAGGGSYSYEMPFNRPITLTVDGGAPVSSVHTGEVLISGNTWGSANQYNTFEIIADLSSLTIPGYVYELADGGVLTASYYWVSARSEVSGGARTLPIRAGLTYYAPGTYNNIPEPGTLALAAAGLLMAGALRMRRQRRRSVSDPRRIRRIRRVLWGGMVSAVAAVVAAASAPARAQVVTLEFSASAVSGVGSSSTGSGWFSSPAFSTSLPLTAGNTAINVPLGGMDAYGDWSGPGGGYYTVDMPFSRPITFAVDGGAPVSFIHAGSVAISGQRGGTVNQYNYFTVFLTLSSPETPDAVYDLADGSVLTADYHSAMGTSAGPNGGLLGPVPITADLTYYAPGTYTAASASPEPGTLALAGTGLLAAGAYRIRQIRRRKA